VDSIIDHGKTRRKQFAFAWIALLSFESVNVMVFRLPVMQRKAGGMVG